MTGRGIGGERDGRSDADDAAELYSKLEPLVMRAFFGAREGWTSLVRHSIALNASFFNAHRVVQQYVTSAYLD